MHITNNYRLPAPLVRALLYDDYDCPTPYSVTDIIAPPQLRVLWSRHKEDVVEDVSQRIWLLLGKGVHRAIEAAQGPLRDPESGHYISGNDILQEERYTYGDVSGALDYASHTNTIYDFKVTSIYAVRDGVKPEWEAQLNMYDLLRNLNGHGRANGLHVCAILRDHSRRHAKDPRFTDCPVAVMGVEHWPMGAQRVFYHGRVECRRAAEEMGDAELAERMPCSDEERWARPDVWAVMKGKNKRAVKLHDDEGSARCHAQALHSKASPHWVQHRPGENVRCMGYCPVAPFCHQWAAIQEGGDE